MSTGKYPKSPRRGGCVLVAGIWAGRGAGAGVARGGSDVAARGGAVGARGCADEGPSVCDSAPTWPPQPTPASSASPTLRLARHVPIRRITSSCNGSGTFASLRATDALRRPAATPDSTPRLFAEAELGETKAKILEATFRRPAREGYAALSVREIAKDAGVNHALISYHFHGKDQLVIAVLDEANRRRRLPVRSVAPRARRLRGARGG
ncbi:MAG: TetR family transcriptional regulator [Deltaproteobacteria bacterium]